MHLAVNLILLGIFIFVVVDAVRSWRGSTGTASQRLLAIGKQSATVLWARCTVLLATLADGLIQLADLVGSPAVAAAIQQYLAPSTVAAIMVAVAVISEWARRRTLRKG
jgi:hypothetical protein